MRRPLPRTALCHPSRRIRHRPVPLRIPHAHSPRRSHALSVFWASLFQKSTDLESWGEATLTAESARRGWCREGCQKIFFLMPARKRWIFCAQRTHVREQQKTPLTPSAQKGCFCSRCDHASSLSPRTALCHPSRRIRQTCAVAHPARTPRAAAAFCSGPRLWL